MKVYFIRHAESTANVSNILASQSEFSLTDEGKCQAQEIAKKFLSEIYITDIISSPLNRALETAAYFQKISKVNLLVNYDLMEQNLGIYAGKTYEEIDSEPNYMHDRAKRWNWVPAGGGESYQMMSRRVMEFFDYLKSNFHDRRTPLIVSHAVTMRLIRAILEDTLPNYPIETAKNGEIWKIDFKYVGYNHKIEEKFYIDNKPYRA